MLAWVMLPGVGHVGGEFVIPASRHKLRRPIRRGREAGAMRSSGGLRWQMALIEATRKIAEDDDGGEEEETWKM